MGRGKLEDGQASKKKKDIFADRLATILLVQSKLLPSTVLGIKDLTKRI